jgi:hypothetical protein
MIRARSAAWWLGAMLVSACHHEPPPPVTSNVPDVPPAIASQPPTAAANLPASASGAVAPLEAFPSPAAGAVWVTLQWGMGEDQAVQALRQAGLEPEQRRWGKTPGGYVTLKRGGWDVTVYLRDGTGVISQILLVGEHLPETVAAATRARMQARFGSPTTTMLRQEHQWRIEGVNAVTLTRSSEGARLRVREQRHRRREGAVGWGSLRWGMSPAEVARTLGQAGLAVDRAIDLPNHCEMPNPPPDCQGPNSSMHFVKAPGEGNATFTPDGGLVELTLWSESVDEAFAQNRWRELQAELGAPADSSDESHLTWAGSTIKASLSLEHHSARDDWTIFEQYVPPESPAPLAAPATR